MQSGTTGINTIRIYNVVKQGYDHDPTGEFVRRWVPELAAVPDRFVQEPWQWSGADQPVGTTYPRPIVDLAESTRLAKTRIYESRRSAEFRAAADQIQDQHGSRKSGIRHRGERPKRRTRASNGAQFELKLS
jgi:deoxyribodipyrimidine photo-lyase